MHVGVINYLTISLNEGKKSVISSKTGNLEKLFICFIIGTYFCQAEQEVPNNLLYTSCLPGNELIHSLTNNMVLVIIWAKAFYWFLVIILFHLSNIKFLRVFKLRLMTSLIKQQSEKSTIHADPRKTLYPIVLKLVAGKKMSAL